MTFKECWKAAAPFSDVERTRLALLFTMDRSAEGVLGCELPCSPSSPPLGGGELVGAPVSIVGIPLRGVSKQVRIVATFVQVLMRERGLLVHLL